MKRWMNGGGTDDSPKKRKFSANGSQGFVKRATAKKNEPNHLEDHGTVVTQLVRANDIAIIMGWPRQGKSSYLPRLLHCLFGVSGKTVAVVQSSSFETKRCAVLIKQDEEKRAITGFSTSFEKDFDSNMKIHVMTDVCFLHEFWNDQSLEKFSAIVVDDFHQRLWQTELIISYLRYCLRKRKRAGKILPKVVFLGCPGDSKWLVNYMKDFSTQTIFLPQEPNRQTEFLQFVSPLDDNDVVRSVVLSLVSALPKVSEGNVLCYLPGAAEVDRAGALCSSWLEERRPDDEFRILTLTEMTRNEEEFHTPGRKIIFADEVAQNAFLNDVRVVIDAGLIRVRETLDDSCSISVDRWRSISRLEASIRERRLERGQPGYVIRLHDVEEAESKSYPSILRSDLGDLLLWLHWCCADSNPCLPCGLSLRDQLLDAAKEALRLVGALKPSEMVTVDSSKLSRIGWQMSSFPLGWRESRSLLAAADLGCLAEVLTIVAMLNSSPVFVIRHRHPRKSAESMLHFRCPEGDAVMLLRVYREFRSALARKDRQWCTQHSLNRTTLFRALTIRRRLREICLEQELPIRSCGDNLALVNVALLHGFVSHLARHTRVMANGEVRHRYRMLGAGGREVELAMDSSLYSSRPPEMIFHLGLEMGTDYVPVMKRACPTDVATVMRVFPGMSIPSDT